MTTQRTIPIRLPVLLALVIGIFAGASGAGILSAYVQARAIRAQAQSFADDCDWIADVIEERDAAGEIGDDAIVVFAHYAALAERYDITTTEKFARAGALLAERARKRERLSDD